MALYEQEHEYTLKDFRKSLSHIVGEVAHGRKRVRVTCYGKTAGYFVSAEEIQYIEALEDEMDRQAIERARAQSQRGQGTPWEQVKADSGF